MNDPKALIEFIIEAIEEVAPGRGAEIYRLGSDRWCQYSARRIQEANQRELSKAVPLLAKQWTQ